MDMSWTRLTMFIAYMDHTDVGPACMYIQLMQHY